MFWWRVKWKIIPLNLRIFGGELNGKESLETLSTGILSHFSNYHDETVFNWHL